MSRVAAFAVAASLAGCQTQGYQQYADTMARIAEAQSQAEQRRFDAVMELARSGRDSTTTILAVALLAGGGSGAKIQQQVIPPQNEALQWAQVILPSVSTLALGYWGYHLGKTQSNNAADVSVAGYGAMQGIAQSGFNAVGQFKPVPLMPNVTNTTTTYTNTGSGVLGSGSVDNSVIVNPPPEPLPGP